MSGKGYASKSWTYIDEYVFGGRKRRKAKKLSSKIKRQIMKRELKNTFKEI